MRIDPLLFSPQKTIVNQCHLYSRRISNINTFVLNQLPLNKFYMVWESNSDMVVWVFVLIHDVRVDRSRIIKSM